MPVILPVRALFMALVAALTLVAATIHAAEEAVPEPPAPPIQNQETPRNAAYSFIMLARDGAWDEAARLLQWPTGMDDAEATPDQVARALKLLLDERIWLDFDAVPGEEANEDGHAGVPGHHHGRGPGA